MSITHSLSRPSQCAFTFADGRRCRTPRCAAHPHFCYFHAREDAQARASIEAGREASSFLSGSYLSACDLSSALCRLFAGVAEGKIKPRTAASLSYLAQTMLNSIQASQHEFISAFGSDDWRKAVRSSLTFGPTTEAAQEETQEANAQEEEAQRKKDKEPEPPLPTNSLSETRG